ncbi:MAG TPA: hypothetical protein VGO75_17595 [Gemmatimonadaceae bacterium]|nr:hypothetical protein [Gemmatimonadaceae bacterium]
MRTSTRRWRPSHLLAAWSAYWIGLALVTLWPAIAAGWRMSRQPQGHGSVTGGFGDGIVSATITESGRTTWSGSVSFLTLTLLVTIPPLLLWILWLAGSSRTNNADENAFEARAGQSELQAKDQHIGIIDKSTSKRRAREET